MYTHIPHVCVDRHFYAISSIKESICNICLQRKDAGNLQKLTTRIANMRISASQCQFFINTQSFLHVLMFEDVLLALIEIIMSQV